jgi:large subunit ribosomal protein L53
MITTYLTTLKTSFNPFQVTSKVPRLFLNVLPPEVHKTVKITTTQLPRTSTVPAVLELGFKDGKTMKFTWAADTLSENAKQNERRAKGASLQDIVEEVDRHARGLARKEELSG